MLETVQEYLRKGWVEANQSWTYASAYTITVPTGAASKYSVGDKIRFSQHGTIKYFYITVVADTLLTVCAGNVYTVENTATYPITLNYLSHESSPVGFPDVFTLTAPTWTTSGTAFANQPSATATFKIVGKMCYIYVFGRANATSGGTGQFTLTFTAGQFPTSFKGYTSGVALNMSTAVNGWVIFEEGVSTVRTFNVSGVALFTNNEYFGVSGWYPYST